jgi:DNA-binding transcriptional LysR family regulator
VKAIREQIKNGVDHIKLNLSGGIMGPAWKELAPHRVITVGRSSGNRALMDNALVQHGLQLNWSYEVTHLSGSLGLVEAGLGVSVLPKLATPAADDPIIRSIPLVQPEIVRTVGIVRRRRAMLSPGATQFLNMLLEN